MFNDALRFRRCGSRRRAAAATAELSAVFRGIQRHLLEHVLSRAVAIGSRTGTEHWAGGDHFDCISPAVSQTSRDELERGMKRFRSNGLGRGTACFAVLGLLFQAALAVTHATAMFALATGQGDGGVQAAMMCHGGGATVSSDAEGVSGKGGGAPLFVKNCPCCLGLVAAAIAPASAGDVALATVSSDRFSQLPAAAPASGKHRLAPESRAPPQPA